MQIFKSACYQIRHGAGLLALLVLFLGYVPNAFSQLSNAEINSLQYMREEERLSHDVYWNLYGLWGTDIFATIAQSELQHTQAVLRLLNLYGVADPAQGLAAGTYAFTELQTLHDTLVSQGQSSVQDALQVGITIEVTDINDLQQELTATNNSAIKRVYNNLLKGSTNHLQAFTTRLEALGGIPAGNGQSEIPGMAVYDPISQSLYIPAINVSSANGSVQVYDALLRLVETLPQTLSLVSASLTDKQVSEVHASYDVGTGIVTIPQLAIGSLSVPSIENSQYSMTLQLLPDSSVFKLFKISSLEVISSP